MMKFIRFDSEKCDSCYKCLRICPTKAISFNKDTRHIIDDLCIKCGKCQNSCPQGALSIQRSSDRVKEMIKNGQRVVASIAPSFVGAFGLKEPGKMVTLLKHMGFHQVEETAVGADLVYEQYNKYLKVSDKNIIITSCCPSVNYLVEQHHPYLIPSLIPVVSPMIAHGLSVKERYGQDTKTVFIGPCLAKKAEAEEAINAIDEVLTFAELESWMKEEKRQFDDYEPETFPVRGSSVGKAFPLGIHLNPKGEVYENIKVDGIDACLDILKELRTGSFNNCCIEMNICEGSCLGGPEMPDTQLGTYGRKIFMKNHLTKQIADPDLANAKPVESHVRLDRTFQNKQDIQSMPNIAMVQNILRKMGKHTKEDELNCGACGYKTCNDKAKAVFQGYSDIETCLPYLRHKAESMQSVMIEYSPNAVVLLDETLEVIEVNPTFANIFNPDDLPVEGMPIELFIQHPIFKQVVEKGESIQNQKIYIDEMDAYYFVNIVYIETQRKLIGFLTDISYDIRRQKEFERVKEETLLKTQEVIDKQMRVAQEIASLLGETTAETKMSLRSLNKLVLEEQGGL